MCTVYSYGEMINSLLEIWLKYAGNMKFTLKYGTARFKLDTRECSTRVYFVTRSECFCEISRVCN